MTTNKTMTSREFLNAIVKANINPELTAYAQAEIDKLDKRNTERKNKPTKAQQENEPIKAKILNYLSEYEGVHLASSIAAACDITTAKASSLCGILSDEGKVKVSEMKVPKVGKRNGYSIVATKPDNEE